MLAYIIGMLLIDSYRIEQVLDHVIAMTSYAADVKRVASTRCGRVVQQYKSTATWKLMAVDGWLVVTHRSTWMG